MGPLAAYSIKSAILLSALFAIYMLTLGRQKDASMRRIALLYICLVSFFLPLLYNLGYRHESIQHVVIPTMPTPTLISGPFPSSISERIITSIIVSGICMGVIFTILGLIRILNLHTKAVYTRGHKFKVMQEGQSSPFCFCGSIYLTEDDLDGLSEMILTHETSHISHLHFIDLFIGRILLILQWWNPLAWLFVKEMQQVHEYQADNDVLNAGYDRKEYQYLLLNRAIGDTKYSFVSGFKHSELRKRLRMINREKPGRRKVIALLIIMLISASFVGFALRRSSIILLINDKLSAININSFRQTAVEPDVKTLDGQPRIIVDGTDIPYESINSIDQSAIESISVWKDQPEHPYGVIEIETKPGMDIYKPENSPQ
ncbi:MAG: M56 family metallopeptidase, partial [Muribaculaceae bacterium]|nr:M56 family metallopeptidase [Muribaculaceae bacterium]